MKKGVALKFSQTGKININFSEVVSGYDSTIQNVVVNLATREKSDNIFPNKGTSLGQELVRGGMFRSNAKHLCNFAMFDTKEFVNKHNSDDEFMGNTVLNCDTNEDGTGIELKIDSTSTKGSKSKFTWSL
tara:strand:- start:4281 stop:4670 length:390 start_codon:yes stop_codon:yes gene_type:complete